MALVQMVFQVCRVLKDTQVWLFLIEQKLSLKIILILTIGDVGEPGIGGGASEPGRKGEMGKFVLIEKKSMNILV